MVNTNKKRICIVVPAHKEALMGGAEYQAQLLTEYLAATNNYEIYYLTRRINKSFKPDGYKIIQVAEPGGIRRFGEFFDTFELMSMLKEISPDVVYQRVGCGYTGITAFYAKKYRKRSVWHVAHDREVMHFDSRLTRNIAFRYLDYKFLVYGLKNASAIITQTQQQADYLWKYFKRRHTAVIPNAHPEPKEETEKNKPIKVVWVANVKPWKRPEIMLQLAKDLENMAGVEFTMIGKLTGDPAWCEQIKKKADQLDNLQFLGGQNQDFVNETLSKSHIFVNTSTQEGFANTFIQSWLRKVPVLTLTVNPDGIFNDQSVGICSDTYDKLKDNLVKLINEESVRNKMGSNAYSYAVKTYSTNNLKRIEKIIFND